MNRKTFLEKSAQLGICSCVLMTILPNASNAAMPGDDEKNVEKLIQEKEFVENWLADLLDAMDKHLDRETQVKLVEYCGKACFNRYQFKKDIAVQGKGDVEKLIEAYRRNFKIEHEGNVVHIRYGGGKCFCPAAIYRPYKPDDLHCECTRMTHQSIFETALGKPVKVDVIESIRRGGTNCHLLVHLT